MTPADMVKAAAAEGVTVSLNPQGKISVKGDSGVVSRWSLILKVRKPELIAHLTAEKAVSHWLSSIGEDAEAIGEVLHLCNEDEEARTYFLWRASGGDS